MVLIDEIDKADSEVPNSLLEALSVCGFQLPFGGVKVSQSGENRPLIVITTNEDRELPPAFVRRCFVLNLDLPKEEKALKGFLRERVDAHARLREKSLDEGVADAAIDLLLADRDEAKAKHLPRPGLADLLDLLDAVVSLPDQTAALGKIREFAFAKHREDDL